MVAVDVVGVMTAVGVAVLSRRHSRSRRRARPIPRALAMRIDVARGSGVHAAHSNRCGVVRGRIVRSRVGAVALLHPSHSCARAHPSWATATAGNGTAQRNIIFKPGDIARLLSAARAPGRTSGLCGGEEEGRDRGAASLPCVRRWRGTGPAQPPEPAGGALIRIRATRAGALKRAARLRLQMISS